MKAKLDLNAPLQDHIAEPESQGLRGHRAGILSVVLPYAIFASVWILASDKVVEWLVRDPATLVVVSTLKGWFFVAVTSLLLFALMQRSRASQSYHPPVAEPSRRLSVPLILLVLAIVALTSAAIFENIRVQRDKEVTRLQTIADLKALQLAEWLKDRQDDARFLQASEFFANSYRQWRSSGKSVYRDQLTAQLEQWRQHQNIAAIHLLDENQEVLWSSTKESLKLAPVLQMAIQKSLADQRVHMVGPYLAATGTLSLDFVAPLPESGGRKVSVVLHTDPRDWLNNNLQVWPVPTQSGEAVLFRRVGDEILYLNQLRFRKESAVQLGLPVADSEVLAAQLMRHEVAMNHLVVGVDYRGVPVAGVAQEIKGTDWYLLAKIDRAELYRGTLTSSIWIAAVGVLAIFISLAGAYLLRQRHHLVLAASVQQSQAQRLHDLQLFLAIFNGSSDAIYAKDLEGRYTMLNPAFCGIFGKLEGEMLGKQSIDLFPADQAAILVAAERKVIADDMAVTSEIQLNTVTGIKSFQTLKGPLHDTAGKVVGTFGIARDITAIKKVELELRDSEARFRALFENVAVAIMIHDPDTGAIIDANRYAIEFYGCETLAELQQHEFWEADSGQAKSVMSLIHRAFSDEVQRFEWQHTNRYGHVFWEDCRVKPIVLDGVERVLSIISDITALKETEQALAVRMRYQRAVLDNFPFSVWLKDTNSRFLAANREFARIAGVADPEQLIGKSDADCWEPAMAERYRADDQAVLKSGRPKVVEEEFTSGDLHFWAETYKSPIELDGRLIGTVGFARDITERKKAEAEISQRNAELERFNRLMIGRELDIVEHKIRINDLSRQVGQEPPFPLAFLYDSPPPRSPTEGGGE